MATLYDGFGIFLWGLLVGPLLIVIGIFFRKSRRAFLIFLAAGSTFLALGSYLIYQHGKQETEILRMREER